jgi:hypothetical protein
MGIMGLLLERIIHMLPTGTDPLHLLDIRFIPLLVTVTLLVILLPAGPVLRILEVLQLRMGEMGRKVGIMD